MYVAGIGLEEGLPLDHWSRTLRL